MGENERTRLEKLERLLKIGFIALALITAFLIVEYAYARAQWEAASRGNGDEPIDYGINEVFLAVRINEEPLHWYTPEELGVRLEKFSEKEYEIFIVDPSKALPWMQDMDILSSPHIIYNNEFYRITDYIRVSPGFFLGGSWRIPLIILFGSMTLLLGILYVKTWRDKQQCKKR